MSDNIEELKRQLAELQQKIAHQEAQTNEQQQHAGRDLVNSPQIVNLGTLVYGRDTSEDERRQLVWYLQKLTSQADQQRLLAGKQQQGAGGTHDGRHGHGWRSTRMRQVKRGGQPVAEIGREQVAVRPTNSRGAPHQPAQ